MIGSVILLGFSGMVIDQSKTDYLATHFVMRVAIYTGGITAMCVFCKMWARRKDQWEGTALATDSGLLISTVQSCHTMKDFC